VLPSFWEPRSYSKRSGPTPAASTSAPVHNMWHFILIYNKLMKKQMSKLPLKRKRKSHSNIMYLSHFLRNRLKKLIHVSDLAPVQDYCFPWKASSAVHKLQCTTSWKQTQQVALVPKAESLHIKCWSWLLNVNVWRKKGNQKHSNNPCFYSQLNVSLIKIVPE
jgi:hypothetical protein